MNESTNESPAAAEALTYQPARPVAVPAAEIGALALRLLGLKVGVDLLSSLASAVAFWGSANLPIGPALVWIAAQVALAIALLAFARPIARFVCGGERVALAGLGTATWMTLIVAGVGLALALFAADELARPFVQYGFATMRGLEPVVLAGLIVPAAKVGVGLLLFFKPSLLVDPWLRRATH